MQTSSGFNINVGVVINKNTKTAALQSLNKLIAEAEKNGTIKLKVDSKNALKQFQTIKTASGDYAKVLTELDKKGKIVHQRITEVGKDLQKAEQYTKKQTRALEEQATALDKVNKKEQQRQAELKKMLANADRISTTKNLSEEIDGINQVIRTYKTLDGTYVETISYYDKMTGKSHEMVSAIMTEAEYTKKKYNEQQKQLKENERLKEKELKAIQKQEEAEKRATAQTEKLAQKQRQLGQEGRKNISIFSDFTNTFMKMVKFNTINLIYDALIDGIRESITAVNDFDKAMTEFKKVTDTSQLSLDDYVKTLSELGSAVGRSATQLLEASTEFSKSGFNAEDSAKLAQVASIYQNVADAELSAGESASYVISQMKAFNIGIDDAISIIDKTNEVKLLLTSINCVNFWKAKIFI